MSYPASNEKKLLPALVNNHGLVLVTGPSGAGRSTAINAFEDLGYEVIDNLPLSLISRLITEKPLDHSIALGIDIRNRDFNTTTLIETVDKLARHPDFWFDVLYIDCRPDVLIRRYNETRRRHPLAPNGTAEEGIINEINLLTPLWTRASHLIDTSELTTHGLKAEVTRWFGTSDAANLAISIQSFSYKRGTPHGADMVFDCRFLRNPYWEERLRNKDGRCQEVQKYISQDDRFWEFYQKTLDLLSFLLPTQLDEGKSYLSIGFGCTGGQHRSVTLAEITANTLAKQGWSVAKRHRELEQCRIGTASTLYTGAKNS